MPQMLIKAFIVMSIASLTTSCFGIRQINELAIVTAVGISVGEKPNTVRLSVQIVRPADARGQTGAPSGGTGEPIYSVSAEGKSIFDAIRNLGEFSSRRVYWAHNFLIVLQEEYARKGIEDMVDFFTRNNELRMDTWVAVTSDKPDELISTITGLEVVPGEAVDRLFRDNIVTGQAPGTNMMNLEEAFLSTTTEPVLARLQLVSRGISNKKPEEHGSIKQVKLAGAAAFKEGRMVGWLSHDDSKGLVFFLENLKSGIEAISCPNNSQRTITLEFKDASLKVTPALRDELPEFRVELTSDADIVESGCEITIENIRTEIEEQLSQLLKAKIEGVLSMAQKEYQSDFLKFGDIFRNKYPEEWRSIEKRWNSVFAEAKVNVEVKTKIKSEVLKVPGKGVK